MISPGVWRTRHFLRGSWWSESTVISYGETWHIRSVVARNLPPNPAIPPLVEPHLHVSLTAITWRQPVEAWLYGNEVWEFDPPLVTQSGETLKVDVLGVNMVNDGREINLYLHYVKCDGPDAKRPLPNVITDKNEELKMVIDDTVNRVVEETVEKKFRKYMEGMWD